MADEILELNTLKHYDSLGFTEAERPMYEVGLSVDSVYNLDCARILSKMYRNGEELLKK